MIINIIAYAFSIIFIVFILSLIPILYNRVRTANLEKQLCEVLYCLEVTKKPYISFEYKTKQFKVEVNQLEEYPAGTFEVAINNVPALRLFYLARHNYVSRELQNLGHMHLNEKLEIIKCAYKICSRKTDAIHKQHKKQKDVENSYFK